MLSQVGIAIVTFAITNIDDLLILSIYFANPEYKTRNIIAGQYLGIISLIVISLIGLLLGALLPDHWISLLGIVPLALGIKGLFLLRKSDVEDEQEEINSKHSSLQYLNVAFVTIANGGDNVGVYAPLFANLSAFDLTIHISVFLLLTAVWCILSYYITNHPTVKLVFEKHGKVILPCFLILLGLFIMKHFGEWLLVMM